MTEYIAYPHLEALIKGMPSLRIYLTIQQREYQRILILSKEQPEKITKEEIYQTLSYGNRKLSDMPKSFPINHDDKIIKIIEQADEIMDIEDFSADFLPMLKEIQKDIFEVGAVVDDIDDAFKILHDDEKAVLREKYWTANPKTWREIGLMLMVEIAQVKTKRVDAINKMLAVLKQKISLDTYYYCMDKIARMDSK
jgi:DNA-directed RNA polymerase sigma subunit (sigma70/sigma32)